MPINIGRDVPWTRKHDKPGTPHIARAPVVMYPESKDLKDPLKELINLCKGVSPTRRPSERMKAAGSHWALSDAAISDHVFLETHDPNNASPAMGRTLYDVIPNCMSVDFLNMMAAREVKPFDADPANVSVNEGLYLVHVETGKRVYQLYAELDLGEESEPRSLAALLNRMTGDTRYSGPWAFGTMGNAGGQTVFGALTTGTHGGDFWMPPLADSVMAMHLVADGGKHYWIEPESPSLTDSYKLRALYGPVSGDAKDFEVIRNDRVFDAVLVSVGRFGIVYSVVLKVVRQYSLHEERRLKMPSQSTRPPPRPLAWQEIRGQIADPESDFYRTPTDYPNRHRLRKLFGTDDKNRYLEIVVSLTPHDNFRKNACGITKRWNIPLAGPDAVTPYGRKERRGEVPRHPNGTTRIDPRIQGPRFPYAGNSHPYSPDSPSFFEKPCADSNVIDGVIEQVCDAISDFVHGNGVHIGGSLAAVTAIGGAAALLALIPALLIILAALLAFLHALKSYGANRPRLGQVVNDVRDLLLNHSDPHLREAGILAWQAFVYTFFESQQGNRDFEAISYAVMDQHDYLQKSCGVNVDSIEVFFAANDPMLPAFIDRLIDFEIQQEGQGRAFVGYAALRFTGPTRALIGMQTAETTCAVEIAGLKDVKGTKELINYATTLALNPNFKGILHWGQRNESSMADIQARFGDSQLFPGGKLGRWRHALSRITENGRLDGFSSAFTRRVGLEVVLPTIDSLTVVPTNAVLGQFVTARWDCSRNPASVEIELEILSPTSVRSSRAGLARTGDVQLGAAERGAYAVRLTAILRFARESRRTSRTAIFTVT